MKSENSEERLHIAVGVIYSEDKERILISKRLPGAHQGGLWEFPGGKLHTGETAQQALQRELYEELGLVLEQAFPLVCFDYDYPALKVKLDVWQVDRWRGAITGKEGQEVAWVSIVDLSEYEFPEANKLILQEIE